MLRWKALKSERQLYTHFDWPTAHDQILSTVREHGVLRLCINVLDLSRTSIQFFTI